MRSNARRGLLGIQCVGTINRGMNANQKNIFVATGCLFALAPIGQYSQKKNDSIIRSSVYSTIVRLVSYIWVLIGQGLIWDEDGVHSTACTKCKSFLGGSTNTEIRGVWCAIEQFMQKRRRKLSVERKKIKSQKIFIRRRGLISRVALKGTKKIIFR